MTADARTRVVAYAAMIRGHLVEDRLDQVRVGVGRPGAYDHERERETVLDAATTIAIRSSIDVDKLVIRRAVDEGADLADRETDPGTALHAKRWAESVAAWLVAAEDAP